MKRNLIILAFFGFFLSRVYVLLNPPSNYSDVFHDYRRYAQMWESGLTPYLIHLYEYPPVTIPVIYLPQVLNRAGIGHYWENYRLEIFFFDLVISWFILRKIISLKTKVGVKTAAIIFYSLAPAIAKDFFYEGIDWIFIGSLSLAIIFAAKRLLFWTLFSLSTGIKFLTGPLALVWLKKDWRQALVGLILIWGVPFLIFRSSLSVMLVYNNARGIKYAAFPSFVIEAINYFTQSETRLNQPPDFPLQGPVAAVADKVVAIVFPLSLLLVLVYGRKNQMDTYPGMIKISLIYFLTMFFTAKIFSQPFHLWYVPLIALYPFKSLKPQLLMMGLATLLLIVDTTPWIKVNEQLLVFEPLRLKFFSYLFLRYIPLASLLWLSIKLPSR
jgi:hypothetical protein